MKISELKKTKPAYTPNTIPTYTVEQIERWQAKRDKHNSVESIAVEEQVSGETIRKYTQAPDKIKNSIGTTALLHLINEGELPTERLTVTKHSKPLFIYVPL